MKALYVEGYGLHLRVQRVNDENSKGRGLSGVTSGAALSLAQGQRMAIGLRFGQSLGHRQYNI